MKNKFKKPLYYIIGLGVLLLISGLVTYPLQLRDKEKSPKSGSFSAPQKRVVSPTGIARFIRIDNLDKKYREEGEYTLSLELTNNEEAKNYLSEITQAIDNFKVVEEKRLGRELKRARLPWRVIPINKTLDGTNRLTDQETKNDEVYLVKYRELGSFNYKGKKIDTQILKFGSNGKPFKSAITPDSQVKVSSDIILFNNVYGVGASLRLKAVQVLKLSEKNPQLIPEEFGFVSESWEATTEENKAKESPTEPLASSTEQSAKPLTEP